VNGFAERPAFQEIRGFEGRGRRLSRNMEGVIFAQADGADLLGHSHHSEMAALAAFEHAQCPQLIQPAHRLARRSDGETQIAG
jgi:hypothetical protein